MSRKVRNDLSKYGVPIHDEPAKTASRVVSSPGGGWVVRNTATGRILSVGSGKPATEGPASSSAQARLIEAADRVIERHREVIKRLAKR